MVTLHPSLDGRSGAALEATVDASFQPAEREETFNWLNVIDGTHTQLTVNSGRVLKRNVSSPLDKIELQLLQQYQALGYPVPQTRETLDGFEMEYLPGLTHFEEIFYDPCITPKQIATKMESKHRLARRMDKELPQLLIAEQREYLLDKEKIKLSELGISAGESCTLTAKIRARAGRIGVNFSEGVYAALTQLEQFAQPLFKEQSQWFIEANGKNFIGEKRIDLNGIFYGLPDSFTLDTPYLLENDFWFTRQRNASSFLPRYTALEQYKCNLVAEKAREEGRDSVRATLAFQAGRVFRNLQEMLYAFDEAKRDDQRIEEEPLLYQTRVLQSMNMIFAYSEFANTGMNTILANCPEATARINGEEYAQGMEYSLKDMARQLGLLDQNGLTPKIQKYYESFIFMRPNYHSFKTNQIPGVLTECRHPQFEKRE